MSNPPLITTVIPTYRRPRLLRRAIRSALGQSYPHVRVCVYDNASGDETEAVVAAIARSDDRVCYFKHAENIGSVGNFIHGIREVATPYFSILPDDDVLTPWFYERVMAGFAQHPDAMFSAMDVIKINESNAILVEPMWPENIGSTYYAPGEAFEGVAKGQIPVPWAGTVFRHETIDELGAPNPAAGPIINDDYILHAAARFSCVVTSGIGCLVTESSTSVGARMNALNDDWPRWWEAVIRDIMMDTMVPVEIKQIAQSVIVPDFQRVAVQQMVQGLGGFDHRGLDYAQQAATGIGECGFPLTSSMMKAFIWLHSSVAPVKFLFDRLVARRKAMKAKQHANLAVEYDYLTGYLRSLESDRTYVMDVLNGDGALDTASMDVVNTQPLITTVIPTYRRPGLLQRAILSVLRQSFQNVVVLVCDNASGDETAEVVRQIAASDPRVIYCCQQKNIGSYNNFNYGIHNVKTPFFSLLSDDDMLLPDFYERTFGALADFPDAMFACMDTIVVDTDVNIMSGPAIPREMKLNAPADGLVGHRLRPVPAAWTGILFRTRVRDEIGYIDADAGPFADGSYVMHAAARFSFVDVPGIGAALMAHKASTSGMIKTVDGEWLKWWDSMARRIELDAKVPQTALAKLHSREIKDVMVFDLGKIAVLQVLRALSVGDGELAMKAAVGAGECKQRLTSALLLMLVYAERWTRMVRPILRLVRSTRRMLRTKDMDSLNDLYEPERAIVQDIQKAASVHQFVLAGRVVRDRARSNANDIRLMDGH